MDEYDKYRTGTCVVYMKRMEGITSSCDTVRVDLENSTGVVFRCAWINSSMARYCARLPFKFMTETPLSYPNSHRLIYIMSV